MNNLLGAGTKVLNALLYMTYHESVENSSLFTIHRINDLKVDRGVIAYNISMGQKALKASFAIVYNQGGLPVASDGNKQLSNFISNTIFGGSIKTFSELSSHLSCTNPQKFPGTIFLNTNLDLLPPAVSSRCKMAMAGNRAIRYAVLAKGFPQKDEEALHANLDPAGMKYILDKNAKLSVAIRIVDLLASLEGNFDAQKHMHPLSKKKPTIPNFTLKLTQAIIYSLTPSGRTNMNKKISNDKILAFQKDENFYGVPDSQGMFIWPILQNSEANFDSLTVETVKGAYGVA